ncbi:unnamed protein product [Closterium sp. Naga37s-1]|nr:unnamed protein product [Closterium sp. Naga37s-1]
MRSPSSSRTRRRLFASLTLFVPIFLVLATCSRLSLPRVHFSLRLEWPDGRPYHNVSSGLPESGHVAASASRRRDLAEIPSAAPPPLLPPPVCECPACPASDSGPGDSGLGEEGARSGGGAGSNGAEGGGEAEATWGENHAFRVHPTSISLFAVVSTYRTGEASFMVVGESLLGAQLHFAGALVDECVWQGAGEGDGEDKGPPIVAPAETLHLRPSEHISLPWGALLIRCAFNASVGSNSRGGVLSVRKRSEEQRQRRSIAHEHAHAVGFDVHGASPLTLHTAPMPVFREKPGLTVDNDTAAVVAPYEETGVVTVTRMKGGRHFVSYYSHQIMNQNDCLYRSRFLTKWLLYTDLDEYIFTPPPATFLSWLDHLPSNASWASMGSYMHSINTCSQPHHGNATNESQLLVEHLPWRAEMPSCSDRAKALVCPGAQGRRKQVVDPRRVNMVSVHRVEEPWDAYGVDWNASFAEPLPKLMHFQGLPVRKPVNVRCRDVKEGPLKEGEVVEDGKGVAGMAEEEELTMGSDDDADAESPEEILAKIDDRSQRVAHFLSDPYPYLHSPSHSLAPRPTAARAFAPLAPSIRPSAPSIRPSLPASLSLPPFGPLSPSIRLSLPPFTLSLPPFTLSLPPFTLSLPPFTLSFPPFTLSLPPFTLSLPPFTLSLPPFTLSLPPFTLSLPPFTLSLHPFTLSLSPFTLSLPPFTLSLHPFTLSLSPFTLSLPPFTLSLHPFTLLLPPFTLSLPPFTLSLPPSAPLSPSIRDAPDFSHASL